MLTKGAIGNLINRYKAVLKKCNLINTFGSLTVAAALVLGGADVANAVGIETNHWSSKKVYNLVLENEVASIESKDLKPIDDTYIQNTIIGGWYVDTDNKGTIAETVNSNITINGGILNESEANNYCSGFITGGFYIDQISEYSKTAVTKNPDEFQTKNTNIIINYVQSEYVIAGSFSKNSDVDFRGQSTKITINDGTFGKTYADTDNPELFVLGGDLIKNTDAKDDGTTYITTGKSQITSTNIDIRGGEFNAAIIGGSGAIEVYQSCKGEIDVDVTNSNINITGGKFTHPIVGGGLTVGGGDSASGTYTFIDENNQSTAYPYKGLNSYVQKTSITIDGSSSNLLDIQHDIYSGGIQSFWADKDKNINIVDSAQINIKNTTIKNIYGQNAEMTLEKLSDNNPIQKYKWNYTPLSGTAVSTELTLTNVKTVDDDKDYTVYIPEGTVTLNSANAGKVTLDNLVVKNADAIIISADGDTNNALDGDATGLKDLITAESVKDIEGKDINLFANKKVVMGPSAVIGEVTTIFDANGDVAENGRSEKPNETNVAMSDLPTISHMLTRVEMNDLRKRMGDIRLLEGNTGVWARWDGGKLKGDAGLTNEFHKIQVGADTVTGIDNLRLGAAFSYTNGDMDFAKANAESDTLSFAGYGVWTADNGMFADVIARLAFIDTEIQTDKVKGDVDNLAFSLSGEFGWRFDFCDRFFVEPQVELTYTYINDDDFTSNGAKFEFDESDSLIGRAGLAAGWALPNDLGELYARASVVQEFMGDGELTVSSGKAVRHLKTDGDDTWFEYGVGANVKVNKNAYVFADVERTEGAQIDEEWRGTVGFRFNF